MLRRASRIRLVPFTMIVGTLVVSIFAGPLAAQSGAKVLTPPRPADTTSRAPATRQPPKSTPGTTTAQPPAPAAPATSAPAIPQSAMLDSIRELVFRNLLERDRAGYATLASAFCLALSTSDFKKPTSAAADRADPTEAMVRRLATARAPARRASTCTFSPNAAGRGVAGRALLYSVGAIDVSSPGRAEAAAGYNYDGYSAGGFTFSVERVDSLWTVKQWRMEWTAKPNAP
ncbi:MAG TPA: hypothetical protein VM076_09770 [Gemmatimonadaceae bacterium]|nr:hypothetical protein [Gemmatimonadaceae bacterium]